MRQIKQGTTPVPDVVFDSFMADLTGAELKVLLYIIRRTYGFGKTKDAISLSQIVEGTKRHNGEPLDKGAGVSKRAACYALDGLESRGLVQRQKQTASNGADIANLYTVTIEDPSPRVQKLHRVKDKELHTPRVQKEPLPRVQKLHTQETVFGDTDLQDTATETTPLQETPAAAFAKEDPESEEIYCRLIAAGMNNSDAARLSKSAPAECLRQLEYLPHKTGIRSTGAYLRSAIEGSWAPPAEYTKKAEADASKEQIETRNQEIEKTRKQEAEKEKAIDEQIQQLDDEQRAQWIEHLDTVWKSTLAKMPPGLPTRMQEGAMRAFTKPEKRRELYLNWIKDR
jgi:hypothetical protein